MTITLLPMLPCYHVTLLHCYIVTLLQIPVEGSAPVDGLAQLPVYQEPYLVLIQGELLVVIALLRYLLAGELVEGASVEVDFLHPVVHVLAEGRVVDIELQGADYERAVTRYVELSEHESGTDEAVAQEHEDILAVVFLMAQTHLSAGSGDAADEASEGLLEGIGRGIGMEA